MDKKKFLELSQTLNSAKRALEGCQQFHLYRFMHFVLSSPLGLDCRYADATLRGFNEENEKEKVKDVLRKAKRDIDTLLQELNS
jgi:hypothetical protein